MVAARGAWLGLVGLLAFAAFVVPLVPRALHASGVRVRDALRHIGETADGALARFRTPEYVAALQRVKETIPRDAAYYLVPADADEGNLVFVRFDLAPRRPMKLGPEEPRPAVKWVVLSRIEPPGPEVVEAAEYFRTGSGG